MEMPVDYSETSRCAPQLDRCLENLPSDIALNIMQYTYVNLCEARDVCQEILARRTESAESGRLAIKVLLFMAILAGVFMLLGLFVDSSGIYLQ